MNSPSSVAEADSTQLLVPRTKDSSTVEYLGLTSLSAVSCHEALYVEFVPFLFVDDFEVYHFAVEEVRHKDRDVAFLSIVVGQEPYVGVSPAQDIVNDEYCCVRIVASDICVVVCKCFDSASGSSISREPLEATRSN